MSIRKRDVHFSDWTKVRHALVCNNIQGITETSSFDEVRTFLINSESGSNPFYYYVCYIKETKEIYTHGQFYDCSKYDDSAILQKIEELESTLDTKVDLTVFEELQSEVKENELVTARALTELNEKKADLFDFNAIKAEIEENEKVAAKAFMDLNERKLDKEELNNIDLSNYVDWDTYYNNLNSTNSAINLKANKTTVDSLQTTVNLKANQTDLNTLSAEVDLKANQSDLDTLSESLNTLSAEVEENEDVTAAALTKLHEDKADKSDLENLYTEMSDNEEVTAAALADIYDKLDNLAIPDMSNYVEATTYQTDIATLSSSDETLQKNIDDVMASSLLKTGQTLTDEEKAQIKDNLGFSSNLVFNNVSADTWVEDTTYADYGYRCDLVCTGVTASDYPEVIFDIEQANSSNYAPVCESDIDIVKIWSKVDDPIIVPTIQIIR